MAGTCLAQYGDISDLKLAKPQDKVDVKSTPPPEGATVLFDGKNLDGWVYRKDGKPAKWELLPGDLMQVKGGDVHTKQTFAGRFKLHVEFRVPYYPGKRGQQRGNSGVYLQGRYEVQILDSYGVKPAMGDCGAIYGVSVPSANACKAPTVWQSFDIDFTAPKFDGKKQTAAARMTVLHNGVKVQDDVPLVKREGGKEAFVANTTSGMGGDPSTPGPVMLQDHGDPVQFRNVWLLPVKE